MLLNHPGLLHDVGEALATLDLPSSWVRMRDALHDYADTHADEVTSAGELLDSAGVMNHLRQAGLAAEADRPVAASSMPLAGLRVSRRHAGRSRGRMVAYFWAIESRSS